MGKSCAFFGHRDFLYGTYEKQVREIVVSLIEKEQVTQFYAGGRGAFDWFCAKIVADIKKEYSQILLTQVLSYIPQKKDEFGYKPPYFDDSVYLLEKQVPPKFAISETNKILVKKSDFIVSGVWHNWGGAYSAVEFAKRQGKTVIDVVE